MDRVSSLAERFFYWCRGTHDPPRPRLRPRWSDCTRWEWLFPRPSLQALSPTAAGTKRQAERGQAGQPTGYVDEPQESGARLWPPLLISITRLFPVPYSPLCKWFECLGAGALLEVPECLPRLGLFMGRLCGLLPPRQGCGSHAHTLGDISILFHTLSFALIFSPSSKLCGSRRRRRSNYYWRPSRGVLLCTLSFPRPEKCCRSNFSSELNNISAPPSHFSYTPPFW